MEPIDENATSYEEAFNNVSDAYIKSAEKNAKANAISREGIELQRKMKARYEATQ